MSRQPETIEIVGVAGAGKSTLARTLSACYPGTRIADSLHTRASAHWPYVAHSIPRVLPLVARSARDRPALGWDETKLIIYVSAWRRFLHHERHDVPGLIVLDQGPIFALARLLWSRKPVTRTRVFQEWMNEMIDCWSVELDAIVRLVAPDDTLLERINHRDQVHETKGKSTRDSVGVLATHKRAYEELFGAIERLGRPPVLRFDTSVMSPITIAAELADVLEASSVPQKVNALGVSR